MTVENPFVIPDPKLAGSRSVELFDKNGTTYAKKLIDPVTYGALIVPVGYVSDGASIPWQFWTVVGHPFNALWIRAALIHDIRCEFKVGTWQETHAQFRELLRLEGVTAHRQGMMFGAVWLFGPRWPARESISPGDLAELVAAREWGDYPKD